jgi:hypothetical protein
MKCKESFALESLKSLEFMVILILIRIAMNPKEKWQEALVLAITAALINAISGM